MEKRKGRMIYVCLTVLLPTLISLCGCSLLSDGHPDLPPYPTPVSSWPMGGHDCRNTAVSEYAGPRSPRFLWRAPTISTPAGGFAVDARGNIFAGQYGVDYLSPSGELLWRNQLLEGNPIEGSPAIGADGTIYVSSYYDGMLYALSPDDGHIIWRLECGSVMTGPTIGPDGTIFVPTYGYAMAINPDGTIRWYFSHNYLFVTPPSVDRWGNSYFPNRHELLFSFDPEGKLRWTFYDSEGFHCPAVIDENEILYIHALSQKVYAIDCNSGRKIWERQLDSGWSQAQCGIGPSGTIYIPSQEGLWALTSDGDIKWHVRGCMTFGQLVIDLDEYLYVNGGVSGMPYGHSIAALTSDGSLLWTLDIGRGQTTQGLAMDARGVLYYGFLNSETEDPNNWYFIAVGDQ